MCLRARAMQEAGCAPKTHAQQRRSHHGTSGMFSLESSRAHGGDHARCTDGNPTRHCKRRAPGRSNKAGWGWGGSIRPDALPASAGWGTRDDAGSGRPLPARRAQDVRQQQPAFSS